MAVEAPPSINPPKRLLIEKMEADSPLSDASDATRQSLQAPPRMGVQWQTRQPSRHKPWVLIPRPTLTRPSVESLNLLKRLVLFNDLEDSRKIPVSIDGEHREGSVVYLYGKNKDGIYHRRPETEMRIHYGGLVRDYHLRKAAGLLPSFDPSSTRVAPDSRVRLTLTIPKRPPQATRGKYTEISDDTETSEDFIDDGDDGDDEVYGRRRTSRLITIRIPPSPRETRLRSRAIRSYADEDYSAESEDSSEEYEIQNSKPKRLPRPPRAIRPAYGVIRKVEELYDSDEETASLRAHRDKCEKCHKDPAHILSKKFGKKTARKRKGKQRADSDTEDEGQALPDLGGWIQCLKCCVGAHWQCLASTQRDEILRAANGKTANKLTKIEPWETTEFICGSCSRGGICMGCGEQVVEPEILVMARSTDHDRTPDELAATPIHASATPLSSNERLFRCLECKRPAHYRHLYAPASVLGPPQDIALYYQQNNRWRCADCISYAEPVDKILAWRPYPLTAVEPVHAPDQLPNFKSSLPREYLVKWIGRSYRRTQWVPHMWLLSTHQAKLKNFIAAGPKVNLLKVPRKEIGSSRGSSASVRATPANSDLVDLLPDGAEISTHQTDISLESPPRSDPLAERRIPKEWITVDRVLDIRLWHPEEIKAKKIKSNPKTIHKRLVDSSDDDDHQIDMEAEVERTGTFEKGITPSEANLETVSQWEERNGREIELADCDEVIWCFLKWVDLGYDEATWDSPPRHGEPGFEEFQNAFQRFLDARKVIVPRLSKQEAISRDTRTAANFEDLRLEDSPELGQDSKFKLMDFQLDGVNWLYYNWWKQQPAILADDMGLGKTVQLITLLGVLVETCDLFPSLVVVPSSTVTNWMREFERWAPRIRAVPFFGEAKSREVLRAYELYHKNPPRGATSLKYHVLLTTYETLTNSKDFTSVFKSVPRWELLIVDEGQRLKSDTSVLFRKLNELTIKYRILMTGTPLNNNIRELFNLMNFLDPDSDSWTDLKQLEKEYGVLTKEHVDRLHEKLKPYFLRRTKAQVLTLPPKNEVIVPVSMAPVQKEVYRGILSQNVNVLKMLTKQVSTTSKVKSTTMRNMLMQLRKCLQHPYLVATELDRRDLPRAQSHKGLIDASAKLLLLKTLLPKLQERNHRVLLFSQFVIALNIIEDFLEEEGFKFLRLDGETKQAERQKDMDRFNSPGSDIFIYILSTRAGGVGVNLWSADTVIIFDPDFNPHQDLQAIARAHRFGQTKPVLVLRLMVKGSAEEKIMQTGKKKLMLDHVIVQTMDNDNADGKDIESILIYGAKALFEDDSATDITYTENDIEKLIIKLEEEKGEEEDEVKASGLTFGFAKIWERSKDDLQELTEESAGMADTTNDYWAAILAKVSAQKSLEEAQEKTGRGTRRKAANVKYVFEDSPVKDRKRSKGSTSGSDHVYADHSSRSSSGSDEEPHVATLQARREAQVELGITLHPPISHPPQLELGPDNIPPNGKMTTQLHHSASGPTPRPSIPIGMHLPDLRRLQATNSPVKAQKSGIVHDPIERQCNLCSTVHGTGKCPSLDSLDNLLALKRKIKEITFKTPEEREAALDSIKQRIKAQIRADGVGAAFARQPGAMSQTNNFASLDRKRAAPTGTTAVPPAKKQRTALCPICGMGQIHPLQNCPVVQSGLGSMREAYRRLSGDNEHPSFAIELLGLISEAERRAARTNNHLA